MKTEPLRIAWMTTARGPGSFGAFEYIVKAIGEGLPVEVAVVFVNRERGDSEATDRFLDLAARNGIPLETISSVDFRKARGGKRSSPGEPLPKWRTEFDDGVVERLERYEFSIVVLFGYMLITTPRLYERFTLLNDHPALPDGPIGTYQQVIAELVREGAAESGCLMNIATGDLDRGPVVSYCRYPIRDSANADLWASARDLRLEGASQTEIERTALYADIRRRGIEREQPFLAETLRAIAEGTIAVPPVQPADLTADVESRLARLR